jgi:serine/threonine-protein kinase
MRICPKCDVVYQGEERVCPDDGTALTTTSSTEGRAFATTAFGPADVRDTPYQPSDSAFATEDEGPDPFIGRTFSGLYEIKQRIGRGGMGTVYIAEHIHLQKQFAIKVLLPEVAKHGMAVERLRQEAVAASRIEHENIVGVVSFDRTEDGDVFIVMELLRGEDLSTVIGRGPLALDRAVPIALQICGALGAAHAAGIVHRDLKPENVFLVKKGDFDFVKVLDFGISKVKSADAEQVRMTKTGQLVGTPLYMSPEQSRGEPDIDKRVDIYALGVMLYEMLSGVPPFHGENYFQLLWKHGNEAPTSLRKRNPNMYIPEAVDRVVLKALAKKRDERYQSMEELEAALVGATPELAALTLPRFSSRPPNLTPVSIDSPRRSASGAPRRAVTERQKMFATAAVLLGVLALGAGLTALATGGGGAAASGVADGGASAAPSEPLDAGVAAHPPPSLDAGSVAALPDAGSVPVGVDAPLDASVRRPRRRLNDQGSVGSQVQIKQEF